MSYCFSWLSSSLEAQNYEKEMSNVLDLRVLHVPNVQDKVFFHGFDQQGDKQQVRRTQIEPIWLAGGLLMEAVSLSKRSLVNRSQLRVQSRGVGFSTATGSLLAVLGVQPDMANKRKKEKKKKRSRKS